MLTVSSGKSSTNTQGAMPTASLLSLSVNFRQYFITIDDASFSEFFSIKYMCLISRLLFVPQKN